MYVDGRGFVVIRSPSAPARPGHPLAGPLAACASSRPTIAPVRVHRPSNRRRNRWVVCLLDVQPTDRILEIGFGPGLAIAELSRRVGSHGHVYGIDRSEVMVRQASKCNSVVIQAGRVALALGTVERLPPTLDGPFDAILAVNSLGFWWAPIERLADSRGRLGPGGRIAIASRRRPAPGRRLPTGENRNPRPRPSRRVRPRRRSSARLSCLRSGSRSS